MENPAIAGSAHSAPVESTTNWMITLLIASIPLIGFIMLIIWAFGSGTNPNKSNFAKATLIWMLVVTVLVFVFTTIFGIAMFSGINS